MTEAATAAACHDTPSPSLLEIGLARSAGDFTAAYLWSGQALAFAESGGADATPGLVDRLAALLLDDRHGGQCQIQQLYLNVAAALVRLMAAGPPGRVAAACRQALQGAICRGGTRRLTAVARALSRLPVGVPRVPPPEVPPRALPSVDFDTLARAVGIADGRRFRRQGRSLVFDRCRGAGGVVVKFADGRDGVRRLGLEAAWMRRLSDHRSLAGAAFAVPVPLPYRGSSRVRTAVGGCRGAALLFEAPASYFIYPMATAGIPPLSWSVFAELMVRNARLLGELMGDGCCHDAPIPLFHNRVQGHRRDDAGRYLWEHGGRLDQWLDSCQFPNFGASGLRDFEHIVPATRSGALSHRYIGDHLLSLVLVCGAYFRGKAPLVRGLDGGGRPADVRHLFDVDALGQLVFDMTAAYAGGVAGTPGPVALPLDTAPLARRLVDEMGVDRHMTEILRVADQAALTPTAFRRLLVDRGMAAEDAARQRRGAVDIHLTSGPHLGPFNGAISVPELIDFLAAAASLTVLSRFRPGPSPRP